MIKRMTIITLLWAVFILGGCGTAPLPTPTPAAGDDEAPARPTPTDVIDVPDNQTPEGYPPPPPTAVPLPEGYPALELLPTRDPYPAAEGAVWILHPVGIQCQDAADSKYPTEQDALSALTAAGISVQQMTTVELMVCQSCDCPTSAHYRAEINAADVDKALALSWTVAQP